MRVPRCIFFSFLPWHRGFVLADKGQRLASNGPWICPGIVECPGGGSRANALLEMATLLISKIRERLPRPHHDHALRVPVSQGVGHQLVENADEVMVLSVFPNQLLLRPRSFIISSITNLLSICLPSEKSGVHKQPLATPYKAKTSTRVRLLASTP